MERTILELATASGGAIVYGSPDTRVLGLAFDSRLVGKGFLFFAFPGLHADGHDYIAKAIERGAAAVVFEREPADFAPGVAYVKSADARVAMSPVADAFHGHPSRKLAMAGVTGTEGKSTTVYLAWQLLELAGFRSGFISTVQFKTGDSVEWNPEHQTTPEATTIHAKLAEMVANGLEYAIVESSSHGLSPRYNRLGDVAFDAGAMTNVRHEHLEFHGTWERYRDDKANLFRMLDRPCHGKVVGGVPRSVPPFAVVCADDPSAGFFASLTAAPVRRYSARDGDAELRAEDISSDARGNDFTLRLDGRVERARVDLPGAFNVENALAALLIASGLSGKPLRDFIPFLPGLKSVRGRMSVVDLGQPFEVIVDYAHTPSSFEAVFPPIRKRAAGRIIAVFGSGGERDVRKRPEQGRIAAEWCDIVVLADEDPRGEDPMALLEEIAAGCAGKSRGKDLFLIPDRRAAIRKAYALAGPGDIVLLLGKGHENSIIYAGKTVPWDEFDVAMDELRSLGYHGG